MRSAVIRRLVALLLIPALLQFHVPTRVRAEGTASPPAAIRAEALAGLNYSYPLLPRRLAPAGRVKTPLQGFVAAAGPGIFGISYSWEQIAEAARVATIATGVFVAVGLLGWLIHWWTSPRTLPSPPAPHVKPPSRPAPVILEPPAPPKPVDPNDLQAIPPWAPITKDQVREAYDILRRQSGVTLDKRRNPPLLNLSLVRNADFDGTTLRLFTQEPEKSYEIRADGFAAVAPMFPTFRLEGESALAGMAVDEWGDLILYGTPALFEAHRIYASTLEGSIDALTVARPRQLQLMPPTLEAWNGRGLRRWLIKPTGARDPILPAAIAPSPAWPQASLAAIAQALKDRPDARWTEQESTLRVTLPELKMRYDGQTLFIFRYEEDRGYGLTVGTRYLEIRGPLGLPFEYHDGAPVLAAAWDVKDGLVLYGTPSLFAAYERWHFGDGALTDSDPMMATLWEDGLALVKPDTLDQPLPPGRTWIVPPPAGPAPTGTLVTKASKQAARSLGLEKDYAVGWFAALREFFWFRTPRAFWRDAEHHPLLAIAGMAWMGSAIVAAFVPALLHPESVRLWAVSLALAAAANVLSHGLWNNAVTFTTPLFRRAA